MLLVIFLLTMSKRLFVVLHQANSSQLQKSNPYLIAFILG
jgi:hypothetical protein